MFPQISSLILLAGSVNAHYFLQSPPSIGFDDTTLTTAPCGGFSATDRSGGVTDWPVSGYPFSVITTHLDVVWAFKAALINNGVVGQFQDIYANVHQTGISEFCIPAIPGIRDWIGRDAVFQVIQKAPDGDLHQCAAIRFVSSGPVPLEDCSNSTSVRATAVPGTGPKPPVTLPSSSSTTTQPPTTAPSTTSEPEPTEDPTTTNEPTVESTIEPTTEPTTEPTVEPTTESTTELSVETTPGPTIEPTDEPTSTTESTHEPTEHSHSTTSGGHHHGTTDTPAYTPPVPHPTLSTTTTSNTTTSLPPPPSYTGGASSIKTFGVSFMVVLVGVFWVF
ncbi:hypothetical protein TWF281_008576 [Arthrobotrys megalospora]